VAEVFADTSGWANFFLTTEPYHVSAVALMRQWRAAGTKILTTNYVVVELVSLFTRPLRVPRPHQVQIIETIQNASWVQIIHIDPTLAEEGWNLLKSRLDKEWSLVDCSSFVVMTQRKITDALTEDHHFEQAGFVSLLGAKP
jgi:predicted nucleic acid-binding protein